MKIFLIVFGLSSGVMVGAGVIAMLVLVGLVPRISHVSNTIPFIGVYERLLIIGTCLGSVLSLQNHNLKMDGVIVIIAGIGYGIFLGFLSSGIAEVIDYIPTISRRLKLPTICLKYIIISLIIGKVIGSLLGWIII